MTEELRADVNAALEEDGALRVTGILRGLDVSPSTWYRQPVSTAARKRPGPAPRPIPEAIEALVLATAETNPWYGYKKIAIICRWSNPEVTNRQAYKVMKRHRLLHVRRPRKPELHQASKLYELLPQRPNDLWQMDVTYIHVPGFGWWYAVTVIDYYSRYLLGLHFCSSYSALEVTMALEQARAEAERIHGPLAKAPFLVTDNGSSFIAHRFRDFVADGYSHVRIQYRTPTQLGLLERFHSTLKEEEVYWQLYDNPAHARGCLAAFRERYNQRRPHWALVPESGGDALTPHNVYVSGHAIRTPKWQGWAKGARERLDKMLAEDALRCSA